MVWLIGHRQPKGVATAMPRPTATASHPYSTDRRWPRTAASQMRNVKDPGRSSGGFGARRWAAMGRQGTFAKVRFDSCMASPTRKPCSARGSRRLKFFIVRIANADCRFLGEEMPKMVGIRLQKCPCKPHICLIPDQLWDQWGRMFESSHPDHLIISACLGQRSSSHGKGSEGRLAVRHGCISHPSCAKWPAARVLGPPGRSTGLFASTTRSRTTVGARRTVRPIRAAGPPVT